MKVAVTLELDDDQRFAVGFMETGRFVLASREQVRAFTTNEVISVIDSAVGIVREHRNKIATEIREELGISERPSTAE